MNPIIVGAGFGGLNAMPSVREQRSARPAGARH